MAVFYNTNITQYEITEPQLTRWRHRYRGVRESLKFNTETQQFLYDVTELYAQNAALSERMTFDLGLVEDGGSITAVVSWDDGSPVEEPVVLAGLDTLVVRAQALNQRITALEG